MVAVPRQPAICLAQAAVAAESRFRPSEAALGLADSGAAPDTAINPATRQSRPSALRSRVGSVSAAATGRPCARAARAISRAAAYRSTGVAETFTGAEGP